MAKKDNDELNIYTGIEEAVEIQKDFIYIKKNSAVSEVFPFTNIFAAICDIGDASLYDSGIPSELVFPVDMNMEVPRVKFIDNESIAYYSPPYGETKEQVLSIIKLFNQLLYRDITIYTSNEIHKNISCFANQNITFCCYNQPGEVFIEANKIITYGYSTRYFIQHKIPTIVIGPYGFGGWVTPENLAYLTRENFRGRPSGRYGESLHHEILLDEILEIEQSINILDVLNKSALIVENYLNGFEIEKIQNVIANINELYHSWSCHSKRWALKAKLVSNVEITQNSDTVCVQRKVINDILFSLPDNDFDFLDDLKNNLTCRELLLKHEVTEEEFWEIMLPLWNLKAIYFSL